jgi:redox-sensitive bicupin YhaK (pirin superfamily)
MLPESEGGFVNRDSRGDRSLIRPGALHWTEAARGMMHEEVPIEPGVVCQGLQIFVNLPSQLKLAEPRSYHLEPDDAPLVELEGASVRVLAGALDGLRSKVQPRTACALWDVTLNPRTSIALPLPEQWEAFGILTKGQLAGFDAQGLAAVRFSKSAEELCLSAGGETVRLVILAGQALNEPLAYGGPFVMNTAEQLRDARVRFMAGDMGQLSPSF